MKTILRLSLALAVSLSAAPAFAAPLPAPVVEQTIVGPVQTLTLKNGMRIILKESHAAPVVTWVVYYRVGSRNEALGTTGSTHFLEHMLFKGTKKLGKGHVAKLLGRNGASFNASTWTDWTNYYETYSSDKLEMGLWLEAERMRNATVPESERLSEMTVVRNELERGESNPGRLLYQEITSQAYKAHPYHHPVIGWRSDVEGTNAKKLKAFYDTFYHPNNAIGVLVGDFKTPEAIALIKKHFEAIPAAKHIPGVYTTEETQLGERRFVMRRKGEVNMLQMGFHVPAVSHKDIAPLMVLDHVLSSGQTDRLTQALVETQLSTGAWASTGVQRDPSLFRVNATLRPGVEHSKVEGIILEEIERLKNESVPDAELAKAKAIAEAHYVFESDGTEGLAMTLGSYEAIDRWQRPFELLDEIKRVSAEDLRRVAKTYLHQDNRTVGWYVSTPDGPVPPKPTNAGSGKAIASNAKVQPLPTFSFEKAVPKQRALTVPVRRVLSNGLTVLVLENPTSPTVAMSGFVKAGGVLDPKDKQGLSALTAEMLDKGTARHSKLELAGILEQVGAKMAFSGGTETTRISASSLSKDTDRTLEAVAEALQTPTFPAEELEKIRTQWVAGIQQAEDQPATRASRALNHAIYSPEHPYYDHTPEQKIAQLKAITPADLKDFHARYYGPNTTTLVVVGNTKADHVARKLEGLFGGWKAATLAPLSIPKTDMTPPTRSIIPMMEKTNVEIVFGNAGVLSRTDKDYYAGRIANYVLGGSGLSSRLGVRLRDELGLTYHTTSNFGSTFGSQPWTAKITVNAANVRPALEGVRNVIKRFLTEGVSETELAEAKGAFVGLQAVSLSTNAGMAGSLADVELYGLGLDYWSRYPQIIGGISRDEVNRIARQIYNPDKAHLIIAGPYQEP